MTTDPFPLENAAVAVERRIQWALAVPAALVAAAVFFAVPGEETPRPITWLATGGASPLEIHGGGVLVYRYGFTGDAVSEDEIAENVRVRARARGIDAHIDFVEDGVMRVELPGVSPTEAAEHAGMLRSSGRLEFTMVVHDHPFSRALYRHVEGDPRAAELGITAEVDMWRADEQPEPFRDYFLKASDRAALEQYLFDLPDSVDDTLPPELRFAIERMPDRGLSSPPREQYRTYLVEKDVAISGREVARAEVVINEYVGTPEVLITFTHAGGRAFADLTASHLGHKLAILLNGDVNSAPVIQSEIRGGQSTITMGGSDPRTMLAEAQDLAGALEAGSLPVAYILERTDYVEASVGSGLLLFARGLFALLAGALMMTFLAIARGLLAAPRAFRVPDAMFWVRLVVTLALPVAILLLGRVDLPTLDEAYVGDPMLGRFEPGISSFALGLQPVFVAFVLVELVAAAVPSFARYRFGGPAGRAPLGIAVAVVALVLAAVQAIFVMRWLAMFGALAGGAWMQYATVATLVGGTFVLVLLVWLVDRFGLGNGFSIAILTEAALEASAWYHRLGSNTTAGDVFVAGLGLLVIVLATLWITRRRALDAARTPTSGVVPITAAFSIIGLLALILALGAPLPETPWSWVQDKGVAEAVLATPGGWTLFGTWGRLGLTLVVIAILWGLLTLAFTRKSIFTGPALRTFGYLAVVAVVYFAVFQKAPMAAFALPIVIFATAIVADLIAEARFRSHHPNLVAVWPLHRVQLADDVANALAEAGIEAHLRGLRHRSLLYVFGPYVPIHVMVPPAWEQAARDLLQERLAS